MNTVTHTDIADWCARLRDAYQHAPEAADTTAVLIEAMAGETYPPRPAWADTVEVDMIAYPEITISFKATQTVGDVQVEAEQTSFVYVDTRECFDGDRHIAGDIATEDMHIYVTPDEFTADTARDLITAAGQLLSKVTAAYGSMPPVVFRDAVTADVRRRVEEHNG